MEDTRWEPPESESGSSLQGSETILVVDDEKVVLDFCTQALTGAGYKVLSATDGYTAIQICKAARSPVHLALLDVRLPRMSGPELLVELLDHLVPLNLSIQFVLMSGYAEPEVTDPGQQVQRRYSFLQKPFTSTALLETVRRKLDSVRLRGRAG